MGPARVKGIENKDLKICPFAHPYTWPKWVQTVPYAKSSIKNTVLQTAHACVGICANRKRERELERSLSSPPDIFKDNENHFTLEWINMQHTHTHTHTNLVQTWTPRQLTPARLYIHSISSLFSTCPLFGWMSAWRLLITVAVPGCLNWSPLHQHPDCSAHTSKEWRGCRAHESRRRIHKCKLAGGTNLANGLFYLYCGFSLCRKTKATLSILPLCWHKQLTLVCFVQCEGNYSFKIAYPLKG